MNGFGDVKDDAENEYASNSDSVVEVSLPGGVSDIVVVVVFVLADARCMESRKWISAVSGRGRS